MQQRVRLALAPVSVSVVVRRQPEEIATDPRGLAFRRVLTERDLAALPDDPEALEEALRAIAGPGAVFRVDGFSASRLPPKSAIREVRISYSDFSAEYHALTRAVVDILTKPGMERFRATFTMRARPSAWSARDAFADRRSETGLATYEGSVAGPLWRQRTSFLAAGTRTTQAIPRPVYAVGPAGPIQDLVSQTRSDTSVWASVGHVLTTTQMAHIRYSEARHDADNLGVGSLTLRERAIDSTATERTVQVSLTGSLGSRLYNQIRFQGSTRRDQENAASPAPAIIVMGAFEAGGGQIGGGRRQTLWSVEDDLDLTWRNHAIRVGIDVEEIGVRSNMWVNREGTYTFASLADYMAGTPLTFSHRIGDPSLSLASREGAAYVQDDVRLAKTLTVSAGLRVEAQSPVRRWNPAPRLSVSWSPFAGGRTVTRVGIGRYYDWISPLVLEQAVRLDGSRQRELVFVRPDGDIDAESLNVRPPERYELAPDLEFPQHLRFMATVEQRLGQATMLTMLYQNVRSSRLTRGWNRNVPVPGSGRPDPAFGNIVQAQSVGRRHQQSFSLRVNWRAPAPLDVLVLGDYALGSVRDDTDGAFAVPADPVALERERHKRDPIFGSERSGRQRRRAHHRAARRRRAQLHEGPRQGDEQRALRVPAVSTGGSGRRDHRRTRPCIRAVGRRAESVQSNEPGGVRGHRDLTTLRSPRWVATGPPARRRAVGPVLSGEGRTRSEAVVSTRTASASFASGLWYHSSCAPTHGEPSWRTAWQPSKGLARRGSSW